MKKRARKSLTWLGVVLLILAGFFIIGTVSTNRSLDDAYAALEAEGRPMKIEDLMPAAIPDADNAALDYDAALLRLAAAEQGDEDLLSSLAEAARNVILKSPDADALDKFRRLYDSGAVAEALKAIEAGSLKPGYQRDLDLNQGVHLKLPHIQNLIKLSKILSATARLQAADGDHAAAWQTALTALRVANALEDEPLLISQMVRIGSLRMAVDSIRHLDLTSGSFVPRAAEIDDLLQRFEDPAPLVAAVDTERLLTSRLMAPGSWSDMAELTGASDPGTKGLMLLYQVLPPLRYSDQATHLRVMGAHARNLAAPYSPETDPGLDQQMIDDIPAHCVITRMCTPAIGSIKPRMVTMFAEARVTRAGLAAVEHRNQTGSYPADLQSLDIENPTDPFTGEPLVYQPGPAGFTLYSVGQDALDDNGAPLDNKRNGDIVWSYSEAGAGGPEN